MIPISNQFLYRQVQFSKNKKTFILFSLKIHSLSPRFNHTSNFSSHKSHHVNARHAIKSMTSYSTMPCNPPPHYHITSHSTCHKHVIKEYDTYVAHLTHIIFNIQNSTFIHNSYMTANLQVNMLCVNGNKLKFKTKLKFFLRLRLVLTSSY